MHENEKWKWNRSVVSDTQRPHGLQPTWLLHPWDFPGKPTGSTQFLFIQWYSNKSLLFPLLSFCFSGQFPSANRLTVMSPLMKIPAFVTHPASASFISYLLIIDFCRVVYRICYLQFFNFPLNPLLSRSLVNSKCLTQWSILCFYLI